MRLEAIELMQALAKGVSTDEALADEAARIAAWAEDQSEPGIATALRALARHHRIRAMELQGRLAAVSEAHNGVFHQGL